MQKITMDGNTAACRVSYALSELAVIYPITPSTPMSELADKWSAVNKTNAFGRVPRVVQMQSESGVAGALHGALSCGALATTYTCSQGLLLMLPNLYKIAGELLPTVVHVSARAIATHALSIFGDHQDVMACRQTGFAILASDSVQEAGDMALVAHLSTLRSSIPFLHFFDGFRTSHEFSVVDALEETELQSLVDERDIRAFRERALSPDRPVARGTAQNDDIYFQNRETANPKYLTLPNTVREVMQKVGVLTGRKYDLFAYTGAPDAERIMIIMGSGAQTAEETAKYLYERGEKVGVIKVRLYRPFDKSAFLSTIPLTCKRIAVLDRTKESGATGGPLYLDVVATVKEADLDIEIYGGRYGLASKDFTPSMVYAVFENLSLENPKNDFTVGINDDLTFTSLPVTHFVNPLPQDCARCKFYGLGSDGTVGANKDTVKIIGDSTDLYAQAYFQYDSRKSGGVTISHLRFSRAPVRAPYLIDEADFIACHDPSYLTRYDMLSDCKNGGTFLLNAPWDTDEELFEHLPPPVKRAIANKQLRFFAINATKISTEVGLGGRTGTIMQAAFFLLHPEIAPYDRLVNALKARLKDTFETKGERVIEMNFTAIDRVKNAVREIRYGAEWKHAVDGKPTLARPNDRYFKSFIEPILTLRGNELPVSAFQADGSVPTGTTRLEKHGASRKIPLWISENCIQCAQCSFVCPHASIRPIVVENETEVPDSFITRPATGIPNAKFRIQVAPHDCMGCGVCAQVCPAKEKALVMRDAEPLRHAEGENWEFACRVPRADTSVFKRNTVKGSQFYPPLFEFSYACSGCGETPYIKVLTQLFGERMVIANATGCSSIYGGSAPTCPYTKNADGKGPAWANSLFEDNAEFGYGMRLAYDTQKDTGKSVWIIGGDGWAYDIGFGGLDHILASGANVNILVLDSQVYSNTGGQVSKATPKGAVAKFAAAGKRRRKKELGLIAMTYADVFVAQVALGADKGQFIKAVTEAEAYEGVSLIIAYATCIAHGFPMQESMSEEKRAVDSGFWHLYRYNPTAEKKFSLDSKAPSLPLRDFLIKENRFAALARSQPETAERLFEESQKEALKRYEFYEKLSKEI